MVKTNIVFFDTVHNGLKGTSRGLISFIPLLITIPLLFYFSGYKQEEAVQSSDIEKITTFSVSSALASKIFAVILISFFLCSAIAVQLSTSYKSAGLYGILVGSVVGASYISLTILANKYSYKDIIIGFSLIILCGLLSLFTRLISLKLSLY